MASTTNPPIRLLALLGKIDLPEAYLYSGLKTLGVEIELVADPQSDNLDIIAAAGITIHPHRSTARVSLKSMRFIKSLVERMRPNVMHYSSNRLLSNGLLATRNIAVKNLAYRGTTGHLSRLDPLSWMTYLHPRLDKIICVSQAVADYMLTLGIAQEKIVQIYKGHKLEWYQVTPIDRATLDIPTDAIVIACAANMRPVKGVDLLVQAFDAIPPIYKPHLLLVGEVRDRRLSSLIAQSPYRDRICVTGFQREAARFVATSDIFVMPSRKREGLPKAVIEAMALSRPVVVSAVGGMPELVQQGLNGVVFPPEDIAALTANLVRLILDKQERARLGAAARARIAQDFSIERTINQSLEVFKLLVSH